MAAISVGPDELRSQADSFRAEADEQAEVTNTSDRLVDELDEIWSGSAKQSFVEKWNDLQPYLVKAEELLEDIAKQLDGVAQVMEDTDNDLANAMK